MHVFYHFFTSIEPILIAFIATVIPAVGAWIVAQLKVNHSATLEAATATASASAEISQKADDIKENTNGITAKHLQTIADKDKLIADLSNKVATALTQKK